VVNKHIKKKSRPKATLKCPVVLTGAISQVEDSSELVAELPYIIDEDFVKYSGKMLVARKFCEVHRDLGVFLGGVDVAIVATHYAIEAPVLGILSNFVEVLVVENFSESLVVPSPSDPLGCIHQPIACHRSEQRDCHGYLGLIPHGLPPGERYGEDYAIYIKICLLHIAWTKFEPVWCDI
jgi:hypothetical protein